MGGGWIEEEMEREKSSLCSALLLKNVFFSI